MMYTGMSLDISCWRQQVNVKIVSTRKATGYDEHTSIN